MIESSHVVWKYPPKLGEKLIKTQDVLKGGETSHLAGKLVKLQRVPETDEVY